MYKITKYFVIENSQLKNTFVQTFVENIFKYILSEKKLIN